MQHQSSSEIPPPREPVPAKNLRSARPEAASSHSPTTAGSTHPKLATPSARAPWDTELPEIAPHLHARRRNRDRRDCPPERIHTADSRTTPPRKRRQRRPSLPANIEVAVARWKQ